MIPEQFGSHADPYYVEVSSKIAFEGREFINLQLWKTPASPDGAHVTTGAQRDVTLSPEQTDAEVETAVRAAAAALLETVGQKLS